MLGAANAIPNAVAHAPYAPSAGIADQSARAYGGSHSNSSPANPDGGAANGNSDENARTRRGNGQASSLRDPGKTTGANRQHCLPC